MAKAKKATKKFVKNRLQASLQQRKRRRGVGKARAGDAVPVAVARDVHSRPRPGTDLSSDDSGDDQHLADTLATSDSDMSDAFASDTSNAAISSSDEDDDDAIVDDADSEALSDDDNDPDENDDFDHDDDGENDEEDDASEADEDDLNAVHRAIESHKASLEQLKTQDPEFYAYLLKNDRSLLHFNEDASNQNGENAGDNADDSFADSADDGTGNMGDDMDEDLEFPVEDAYVEGPPVITHTMLMQWSMQVQEKHSLRALKKLIQAYRAAAFFDDNADETDSPRVFKFRIESNAVFNKLVFIVSKFAVPCFSKHLHFVTPPLNSSMANVPSDAAVKTNSASTHITKLPSGTNSKVYNQLVPLIKSFVVSTMRLLTTLAPTSSLRQFIMRCIRSHALPYIVEFPRHLKNLVNVALDAVFVSEQPENVVVLGIGLLKDLIVLGARIQHLAQKGIVEKVLRNTYLSYLRTLPTPSAYNIAKVQFLQTCIKQLFLIDRASGYKLAFVYVRQLAIALRALLSGRTRSALKKVTSHKFIAAAELLAQIVPSFPELVYPLAQVVIGSFKTILHVRYAPLRLRLLHILVALTEESGVEIPIAGLVLEMLSNTPSLSSQSGSRSASKPQPLAGICKVSRVYSSTIQYRESVLESLCHLLARFWASTSPRVGFPESTYLIIPDLKRWTKSAPFSRSHKMFATLVAKTYDTVKIVEDARLSAETAPNDVTAIEALERRLEERQPALPIRQWVEGLRRVELMIQRQDEVGKITQKKGSTTLKKEFTAKSNKADRFHKKLNFIEDHAVQDEVGGEDDVVEDFDFSSDEE